MFNLKKKSQWSLKCDYGILKKNKTKHYHYMEESSDITNYLKEY